MGPGARRSLDGKRTLIIMNPRQHRTWAMRMAVFYHECAHFSQPGGVVPRRRKIQERRRLELRADCLGIQMMARRGLLSVNGWKYIQRRVMAIREGRKRTHPAGPIRIANMRRCLQKIGNPIRPNHRVPRITRW